MHRAGKVPLSDAQVRTVATEGALPKSLGARNLASLALAGTGLSEAAAYAIANLLAITLERERAQAATGPAEPRALASVGAPKSG